MVADFKVGGEGLVFDCVSLSGVVCGIELVGRLVENTLIQSDGMTDEVESFPCLVIQNHYSHRT